MKEEMDAMANEIPITFKASETMEKALQKIITDSDRCKSEIIRAAICLGLPVLAANPSLIYRLDFSEFKIQKQ
jgi:hypothetical protein